MEIINADAKWTRLSTSLAAAPNTQLQSFSHESQELRCNLMSFNESGAEGSTFFWFAIKDVLAHSCVSVHDSLFFRPILFFSLQPIA